MEKLIIALTLMFLQQKLREQTGRVLRDQQTNNVRLMQLFQEEHDLQIQAHSKSRPEISKLF